MLKILIYTGCFLAVVGICLYGYFAIDGRGYDRGVGETEALWLAKATEALGKKIDNIKEFNEVLTQRTLNYNKDVEDLEREYAEDLEYVELGKDMAIAAVLDGVVKLYDPFNPERTGQGSHCRGAEKTGGITVCADVSDDSSGGELHPKTAAFLFGEALRADGYTEQLGRCQESVHILQLACRAKDANSTN